MALVSLFYPIFLGYVVYDNEDAAARPYFS